MRRIWGCFLLMFPLAIMAQSNGIQFTDAASWSEVLQKAKAEQKFIFVDVNASWCVPCKKMKREVFSRNEVGEYMNQRFINVYLQVDTTKNDKDMIKRWYADAALLKDKYDVRNFPTFLYFDPEGHLVHKTVGGDSANDFITNSAYAFLPDRQYISLMKKCEDGDCTGDCLYYAAIAAEQAAESEKATALAERFLRNVNPEELMTKERVEFLRFYTENRQDVDGPGFKIYQQYAGQIDSIAGAGEADRVKKALVGREIEKELASVDQPDWQKIYHRFKTRYPALIDPLFLKVKVDLLADKSDWSAYIKEIDTLRRKYPSEIIWDELANYAYQLVLETHDKIYLQEALAWFDEVSLDDPRPLLLSIKACLLYQLGQQSLGIQWQERAVKLAPDEDKEGFDYFLQRMKKGTDLCSPEP